VAGLMMGLMSEVPVVSDRVIPDDSVAACERVLFCLEMCVCASKAWLTMDLYPTEGWCCRLASVGCVEEGGAAAADADFSASFAHAASSQKSPKPAFDSKAGSERPEKPGWLVDEGPEGAKPGMPYSLLRSATVSSGAPIS
jgi:hypothetical protein